MLNKIICWRRPFVIAAALTAGIFCLSAAGVFLLRVQPLHAQRNGASLTPQEKAIVNKLRGLRQLSEKKRGRETKELALQIRKLPDSLNKVRLAMGLAELSTEGDPGGSATLQAVTTTLAGSLRGEPQPPEHGQPAMPYAELAALVHYEHMEVSLNSPEFTAATSQLEAEEARRQHANFTLADLQGKGWTLGNLRGKVVLLNFWATWCPPCRKEIADLEMLHNRFGDQGLIILGIDDETAAKIQPFVLKHGVTYSVLLDPGDKVHKLFSVEGIPMTFLYDRNGNLTAESMDMRTRKQFLEMLATAGLQ